MAIVLIADDSASVRLLLQMTLTAHHTVLEAKDGGEAVELLRQHRPDVAVLDVVMPVLSGLQVCRLLREDPALRDIRVIMLSANATADDASQAGADCFFVKPFSPSTLLRTINDLSNDPQVSSAEAPCA